MASTSANNLNAPGLVSPTSDIAFQGASSPFDYQTLIEGNARLTNLSGQLLGAHIAHAGLIMFWAGSTTLSQAINCDFSLPPGEQNLFLIANLARLGWGVRGCSQTSEKVPL